MLALVIILGYMSLSLVLRSGENEKWNENQSTTVDKISHSKTVDLGQGYTKDWCEGGVTVNVSEARPHKVENVKYSYDGKFGWWGKASGNQDIIIYNLSYKYLEEEEHAPIIIGDVTITDTTKSNGKGKNSSDWSFDVTTKYNIIHCKNYSCTNNIVPWDPDTKNLIPYISSDSPYKTNKIWFEITQTTTWNDIHKAFIDSGIIVKDSPAYGVFNSGKRARVKPEMLEFIKNTDCDICKRSDCFKAKYHFDYIFSEASITIPELAVDANLIGATTMKEWNELIDHVIKHENVHRKNFLKYVLLVLKPTEFKYIHCYYCEEKRDFNVQYDSALKSHTDAIKNAYFEKDKVDSAFDAQEMIYKAIRNFFYGNTPASF